MGYRLNPLTGEFDLVDLPLVNGTSVPTMSGNGDLQVAEISGDGRIYWEVNGTRYYASGIKPAASPINILAGQPIPIGMGLTFTYANNVN